MPIARERLRPVVDIKSNHGSAELHKRTVICPKSPSQLPSQHQHQQIVRRNLRIKDKIHSNLWIVVDDQEKLRLHRISKIEKGSITYSHDSPWILRKHKNGWLTQEASKDCQLEWLGSAEDSKLVELLSVMPIEYCRPLQSSSGKIIELWSTIF